MKKRRKSDAIYNDTWETKKKKKEEKVSKWIKWVRDSNSSFIYLLFSFVFIFLYSVYCMWERDFYFQNEIQNFFVKTKTKQNLN